MSPKNKSLEAAKKHAMSKEELLHMADELLKQAFMVNSFRSVIDQYASNAHEYLDEMNCSPAFYRVTYHALKESSFLYLSRLYDQDSKSISIACLLRDMNRYSEGYLHSQLKDAYEHFGVITHRLKKEEEPFFEKEVEEQKRLCAELGVEYICTNVSLSYRDLLDVYNKRYRSIKKEKIIERLTENRNKIIAHNDEKVAFRYGELLKEFPLPAEDISKLIDFAIDFTQFSVAVLTGTTKAMLGVNHDDLETTLVLVREGLIQRKKQFQSAFE